MFVCFIVLKKWRETKSKQIIFYERKENDWKIELFSVSCQRKKQMTQQKTNWLTFNVRLMNKLSQQKWRDLVWVFCICFHIPTSWCQARSSSLVLFLLSGLQLSTKWCYAFLEESYKKKTTQKWDAVCFSLNRVRYICVKKCNYCIWSRWHKLVCFSKISLWFCAFDWQML